MNAVLTYFSPVYLTAPSWIPSLLLGIVIFFTGLSMKLDALLDVRKKKREVFIATFLKWTITVLISVGIAYGFFASKPELAAGIILSGTVPSATAATLYTFLAGGNTSLVIASSLVDVILSPIITPLSFLGMTGTSVSISFSDLLKSFIMIVVLPLGLGVFIQRRIPNISHYASSATKFSSSLSLLLIIHLIIGSGKNAIAQELHILPLLFFFVFIQVVLPMIASYFIAKKLSVKEEDARAILFQVGLCNTALAAILAFEFIGELAVVAPIINMVLNLSIGSWLANYFMKKDVAEQL